MNDGGSAFPMVIPGMVYNDGSCNGPNIEASGMTLRDYFAASALHGILGGSTLHAMNVAVGKKSGSDEEKGWLLCHGVASCAYEFADAMIEARKREPPLRT